MYLEDINRLAEEAGMTNYGGDYEEGYTGFNDEHVDLGNKGLNFGTEIGSGKYFGMTLTNGTGIDQQVILFPSYDPSNPAAVITDGTIIPGLTATASRGKISSLLKFIERNPTSIVGFKMVSTMTTQLAQSVTIEMKSPFEKLGQEYIELSAFTNERSTNDKMVSAVRPFQVDDQTEVSLTLLAGASLVISLFCGATLNNAKALKNKSNRAGRNPGVAQARAMLTNGIGR